MNNYYTFKNLSSSILQTLFLLLLYKQYYHWYVN